MRRNIIAAIALAAAPATAQCNLLWQASNTVGTVSQLKRISNGDIIAVGSFTSIDGIAANGAARYDDTGWHAIGNGPGSATAVAEMPNGGLAVKTTSGHQIWNGTTWQVGPPTPFFHGQSDLLACLPNGNLVTAGTITPAAPNYFTHVKEWDGTSWQTIGISTLGTDPANSYPTGIGILPSGELILSGDWGRMEPFGTIGGYNEVVRWDGSLWHRVIDLPEPRTLHIARNGEVYAAGRWSFASTAPLTYCGVANGLLDAFVMTDLPNGDLVTGGWVNGVNPWPHPVTVHRCDWNGSTYTELAAGATFAQAGYPFDNMVSHDDGTIMVTGPITIGGTSSQLAYLRSSCPTSVTSTPTSCTGASGALTLTATQSAWIGSQFTGETVGFGSNAIAVHVLSLQTLATPLANLLPQGLPNCDLLVAPDVLTVAMPTAGVSSYSNPVPQQVALNGLNVHLQTMQVEAIGGGPQWELSSSNRLTFTIGVF